MSDPHWMYSPGRSAVQRSGINDHRTRASVQKCGKMLEKRNNAFSEALGEDQGSRFSWSFHQGSEQSCTGKEFLLKHWKDLRVQQDIAKWESSCETFQLWLEWRAIPPQSITWRFPKMAPPEQSLVVNDWSGEARNSLNTLPQQGKA